MMRKTLFTALALAMLLFAAGTCWGTEPAACACEEAFDYNPLYGESILAEAPVPVPSDGSLLGQNGITYYSIETAGEFVRQQMKARENIIELTLWRPLYGEEDIFHLLLDEAFRHTGVPSEGDYLYYHYKSAYYQATHETYITGVDYYITLTVTYATTAVQEAVMDFAVADLLEPLTEKALSDHDMVWVLYSYVTDNVVYDTAGLNNGDPGVYTAYNALIKGKTVCQGYALLMYRLLLEEGIDCRFVGSADHAWNIVRLEGLYYYIDSTWDAGQTGANWEYFLRGIEDFDGHDPLSDEFLTDEFTSGYNMALFNYYAWWGLAHDGTLYVFCEGDMPDFSLETMEDSPWYEESRNVRSIVVCDGVTSIGDYAFLSCWYAEDVYIPESVTRIGCGAFGYCESLREAYLPDALCAIEPLTFCGCTSLEFVWVPENLTDVGSYAFCDCSSLDSLYIPDTVTTIGYHAFEGCAAMREIYLPDGLSFIGDGAFMNSGLVSVKIPKKITTIGDDTFRGACSLREIILPRTLTWIFDNAFSGCASLGDVYYMGTKRQFEETAIVSGNEPLLHADIHYLAEKVRSATVFGISRYVDDGENVYDVTIYSTPDVQAAMMVAWYDDEGRFIGMAVRDLTPDECEGYSIWAGDSPEVKLFAVDGLYTPLCEAEELTEIP